MTSMLPAVPDLETLTVIVGDVFAGLLGGELAHTPRIMDPLPVTASVSVSGAWAGRVVFACSEPFAQRVAAALFAREGGGVGDEDLLDVAGELANVIGGNVKSVMPGPSVLSLPHSSLEATEAPMAPVGPHDSVRVELAWYDEPMRVSVWTDPENPPSLHH